MSAVQGKKLTLIALGVILLSIVVLGAYGLYLEWSGEQRLDWPLAVSLGMLALGLLLAAVYGISLKQQIDDSRALRHAKDGLEEALRASKANEEKYRNLYENAVEGIYQLLPTGRFLSVNPAFAKLLGYRSPDDLLEQVSDANAELYADREARRANLNRLGPDNPQTSFEAKVRRADSTLLWLSENLRAVHDLEGRLLYYESFATDITQRKEAEAEAKRALEEALSANRAKNKFIEVLSHELRTPLTSIIGFVEIIRENDSIQAEPEVLEDLNRITHAGEHLLALISDLLDLSKVEAGTMPFEVQRLNLREVLLEVVSALEHIAKVNQNTLELNCADHLGEMEIDPTRLRQILYNLLNNALKFTRNGTVSLSAYRQYRKGEDWVIICVQDSGVGMTQEEIRKLSEELNNPDVWATRKDGSAGMGLTISNRLSKAMGGFLTVSGVTGRGSTFEVWLPAKVSARHGEITV